MSNSALEQFLVTVRNEFITQWLRGKTVIADGSDTSSSLSVGGRCSDKQSGKEVCQMKAGCSVVCMTSYNNMLFAGCYDGNIYVFSLQDKKHITTFAGPGKMLLCMDIVKNRVIAGCKEGNKLEAWSFPAELKTISKEAKQHR